MSKTVLIIDDSATMRSILKKMLSPFNFTTVEAGNGQEGLDQINAMNECDLALIDWNMPVMNGLEFVKSVRADATKNHTKLVMVTTETEFSRISEAMGAGANEYIMKPFSHDILTDKLKLVGLI